jgi:hypothetical protein
MQTRFHLIVCTRVGHDAVLATGLLLYNLPHIAKRYRPEKLQVWKLRSAESKPERWGHLVESLHARKGYRVDEYLLPEEELLRPVLPR